MCVFVSQLIQAKLADMYTISKASRAYLHQVARDADEKGANRKDCASVILYTAEHATRMALDAIQVGSHDTIVCFADI